MPTTILLIRHAEVHNPRDILYGRLPRYRLSERGKRQAEVTARFLAPRPVAAIYTSPLLRARQTADILTTYHPGALLRRSKLLLETRTSYQGNPNSILKPGFSFYEPQHHPDDETMPEIWERMRRFLEMAARRHPGQVVVGISHADPITIMRVGLLGLPMTSQSLHSVVYAARSSVTQLVVYPNQPHSMTYFNVADVSEVKL